MTETVPASVRVVQGVAAREGVDPVDLDPPLHAVVDTDALDALFRSPGDDPRTPVSVEFTYRGHRVRVDGAGEVAVATAAELPAAGGEE